MPDVSIIIPVHNMQAYLEECLDSILGQTFWDFEVICVNDCSRDGSLALLACYAEQDSRFHIINLTKNGGPGPARNLGIEKASGKYCLFCDADDAYPPYALQVLFDHAEKYHADVACGNILIMDSQLRYCQGMDALHTALAIKEEALVYNLDHPSLWWPLYHQKFLISTALLRENNITYPALRHGEDPVFLAEVLCAAKSVAITPHAVYFYRIVEKNRMPHSRAWLQYLDHFSATLDSFLRAEQMHCACLYYVLSISAWHNFSQWWRLSRDERKEESAKFTAYVAKMQVYSPWEQDYAPYPVDREALRSREAFYLKYGHGLSCLRMAVHWVMHKIARLFSKLRRA